MGFLRRDAETITQKQKWDYINLDDFKTRSCWSPIAYFFFFVNVFFGIAVVAADCYTAVNLLIFNRWSSKIQPWVPFSISKWIFAGCIIFSFVLIGFSAIFSVRAVKGNGIARGYLNVYAQRWWCIGRGGYKRFLVFTALTKSKHGSDYVMLFTYFSFKGWAQVLLADGPRQVLNGITLAAVIQAKIIPGAKTGISGLFSSIAALEEESLTQAIILSVMLFTCVWWVFTVLQLAAAALLWIMFIWHHVPSGHTLGSYCREKIDKRLVGIVAKNHKRTLEEEREERMKADKAGNGARQPKLPIFGDEQAAPPKSSANLPAPTLPVFNEKPTAPGLKRTNTTDTFTTTVSSRPDTNMPSRPPYAARPGFPNRTSTNSTAQSNFDDSASLMGADRRDPFYRTGTPLNRPQPPIGPYRGNYNNDSQSSLTNPYESAPMQPHDFLGNSQGFPPINRNDTVSPFYQQRPPPVSRADTISPMQNRAYNNATPMRTNTPQQYPPNGMPRRLPVRQDQGYAPNLPQPPISHTPSPAPEFSTYTEHRHTPPIHHKPESEVFEMDAGITTPSEPASAAIEIGSSSPKSAPAKKDGFVFELDTGVPVVTSPSNASPETRTRRLTPPEPMTTPVPQQAPRSPPRNAGLPAYVKPTYQSTAPPQIPAQSFEREEHGVGRNFYGNYDIEADVLDSYLPSSQMQPPQQLSRPFAHNGGQGSRPGTPTRGLPVRRDSSDSYHSNAGSALGNGFAPPVRSMTATPTMGNTRGIGELHMPPRSATAQPYGGSQPAVRSPPPRGNSTIFENGPRGLREQNNQYQQHQQGGYGGYGNW
ncbi:hypothetical protein TWF694_011365 [Orbilia ellipsospora]|uniref:Pheromone-regulated membrane protein 6 n=1 Tax=Orbilia ellipsospora TaxID=2528407 RepID=A0AAV9XB87_9PEZI